MISSGQIYVAVCHRQIVAVTACLQLATQTENFSGKGLQFSFILIYIDLTIIINCYKTITNFTHLA